MTFKAVAVTGILGCLFSAFASATPMAAEEGVHIKDNLQSKTAISSPVGLRILDTLRKFKTAYEAGDIESFRTLFSNDFRMIYLFGDKKSKSLDLNEFSQRIGRQLNVSFSHLKADQENNIVSAVTKIRYKGKWFWHNELVIFFFKKNAPDKIRGVISTPIYPASYQKGNKTSKNRFIENLNTWKSDDKDKNRILRVIVKELKPGLEKLDIETLNNILTDDFEHRLVLNVKSANIQDRSTYISLLKDLSQTYQPVRRISYSIRGMQKNKTGSNVFVTSVTKIKTRHHQAYFLEFLTFTSVKGDWKISRQQLIPYPRWEIAEKSGKFILLYESDYNKFLPDINKYGTLNRDVIFEKMSAKSASQITTSLDTSDIFVAVFIPNFFVKPGSIITIEHLYRPTGSARRWFSYGQDFKVNKVQPYIFAATTAWASFLYGGTVEMTAYVDGYEIHTEIFKLVSDR